MVMSSNEELDPFAILTEFGIDNPTSVISIDGGNDTAMWRVQSADKTYALRIFRPDQKVQYQVEQTAIEFADKANLPVPQVVAKKIYNDFPVMLLSWCPGITLGQQVMLKPWLVWTLGKSFGLIQARMHAITVSANIFHFVTDWINWKTDGEIELQQALRNSTIVSDSLIHMDFHHHNVVVEGKQITGIIDWGNARVGDPRADFARTYTILRIEPWGDKPSFVQTIFRWLFEKAWRSGYKQVAGLLHDMPLFYAWAGAVMTRDLAPRVDQPDTWFQKRHLDTIRNWTNKWKQRIGIPTL